MMASLPGGATRKHQAESDGEERPNSTTTQREVINNIFHFHLSPRRTPSDAQEKLHWQSAIARKLCRSIEERKKRSARSARLRKPLAARLMKGEKTLIWRGSAGDPKHRSIEGRAGSVTGIRS